MMQLFERREYWDVLIIIFMLAGIWLCNRYAYRHYRVDRSKLKTGIDDIMRDYEGCDMDNPTEERFAAGLLSAVEYIGHGLGYPEWIEIKDKTEEDRHGK